MATITVQLTDEEQNGLLSLVDEALRKNGLGALTAAVHWSQKLTQAHKTEDEDANDNSTISGNA